MLKLQLRSHKVLFRRQSSHYAFQTFFYISARASDAPRLSVQQKLAEVTMRMNFKVLQNITDNSILRSWTCELGHCFDQKDFRKKEVVDLWKFFSQLPVEGDNSPTF